MKTLLTFAHYLEAISFIEGDKLAKKSDQYFCGDSYDILITGEGQEKVILELTKQLSHHQYSLIINIGVAAALKQELKNHKIYEIKTCYAHNGISALFQSFEIDGKNTFDCVSINHRAKNKDEKEKYSPMAEILDRELWANCLVAKSFKTSIQSIKIISDEIDAEDFCQMVTESAYIYSDKLYAYFKQQLKLNHQIENLKSIFYYPDFLHLTQSMEHRLKELIDVYCIQNNFSSEEFWAQEILIQFNNKDKTRKQNAIELIRFIEKEINPIMSKVEDRLTELTKGLKNQNIKVKFSQNYENTNFVISGEVTSEQHLQRIINELQTLKIKEIYQVLNGDIR